MDRPRARLDRYDIVAISLSMIGMMALLVWFGDSHASERWRREAVRNGAAEWRADETGAPRFTWVSGLEAKP